MEDIQLNILKNLEKNLKKADGKNNEIFNILKIIIKSNILKAKNSR